MPPPNDHQVRTWAVLLWVFQFFRVVWASWRREGYWIPPKTCNSGRLHNLRYRATNVYIHIHIHNRPLHLYTYTYIMYTYIYTHLYIYIFVMYIWIPGGVGYMTLQGTSGWADSNIPTFCITYEYIRIHENIRIREKLSFQGRAYINIYSLYTYQYIHIQYINIHTYTNVFIGNVHW